MSLSLNLIPRCTLTNKKKKKVIRRERNAKLSEESIVFINNLPKSITNEDGLYKSIFIDLECGLKPEVFKRPCLKCNKQFWTKKTDGRTIFFTCIKCRTTDVSVLEPD